MLKVNYGDFIEYTNLTYNQYTINYLNPFHPLSRIRATFEYPHFDNKNVEKPNVEPSEVLKLFPQYRELFEEQGEIYTMFLFLLDFSKNMVSYEIVSEDNMFKHLVVLHTAHHLQLHIRDWKDEANLVSHNNEVVEKNYYLKDMIEFLDKGEKDSFYLTIYGKRFIEYYGNLTELHIKGGYINGRKVRPFR